MKIIVLRFVEFFNQQIKDDGLTRLQYVFKIFSVILMGYIILAPIIVGLSLLFPSISLSRESFETESISDYLLFCILAPFYETILYIMLLKIFNFIIKKSEYTAIMCGALVGLLHFSTNGFGILFNYWGFYIQAKVYFTERIRRVIPYEDLDIFTIFKSIPQNTWFILFLIHAINNTFAIILDAIPDPTNIYPF
jgi:hypothetical protein